MLITFSSEHCIQPHYFFNDNRTSWYTICEFTKVRSHSHLQCSLVHSGIVMFENIQESSRVKEFYDDFFKQVPIEK